MAGRGETADAGRPGEGDRVVDVRAATATLRELAHGITRRRCVTTVSPRPLRAAATGGSIEVVTAPGAGTAVRGLVPVGEAPGRTAGGSTVAGR